VSFELIERKFRRPAFAGPTLVLFCIAVHLAGCNRLRQPPRPPGAPDDAIRNRTTGLWMYSAPDGEFRMYYESGTVAYTGQVENGLRTGHWQTFASDGQRVTASGDYRQNWRDGIWRYFDGRERLYLTVEYRPEPKRFFGLLNITDYGNENGPFERYFPDGSLEERGVFWSGYYHGPIVRYHRNGRKAFEGEYEKDLPVGLWRYYYPEGTLEREETYRNGKLHGTLRNYYPDGGLYHETIFEDGVEVGPKRVYTDYTRS
jgi:antitoxin component YwqK of YwqJK toxin-antitoxin module